MTCMRSTHAEYQDRYSWLEVGRIALAGLSLFLPYALSIPQHQRAIFFIILIFNYVLFIYLFIYLFHQLEFHSIRLIQIIIYIKLNIT